MFKKYWFNSQKGKVIRIMLIQWIDKWYEDFECEKLYKFFWEHIFVWNNAGARLSQLKKDWVVEVEYFDNENAIKKWMSKRARYKLTPQAVEFYKTYYSLIW